MRPTEPVIPNNPQGGFDITGALEAVLKAGRSGESNDVLLSSMTQALKEYLDQSKSQSTDPGSTSPSQYESRSVPSGPGNSGGQRSDGLPPPSNSLDTSSGNSPFSGVAVDPGEDSDPSSENEAPVGPNAGVGLQGAVAPSTSADPSSGGGNGTSLLHGIDTSGIPVSTDKGDLKPPSRRAAEPSSPPSDQPPSPPDAPPPLSDAERSFGPEQKRPQGDTRSAQDIINSDDLFKNLGNQNDIKSSLKKQVGDFDHDPDAAYRLLQVLHHVEKFDDSGNAIENHGSRGRGDESVNTVDDGKINGYTSHDEARHGTEAGRLQDFGKYGYSSLHGGDWSPAPLPPPPVLPPPAEQTFGPSEQRPEGDYRSADEIINSDPLLKNLGNQNGQKEGLKKQLGDFEHDPDAAYRLQQLLHHVEKFDNDGNPIENHGSRGRGDQSVDTVDNGLIDGFASHDQAQHGTEADRLQNFIKNGYGAVKGGDPTELQPGPPPQLPLPNQVRPDGDTRSAQDIIDANPTLKNLGNQEGVKDMLRQQVGDYEHDADAAYRASMVIDYIKQVDGNGNPSQKSDGNDPGSDKIEGFSFSKSDGHDVADPNTEAARLKDFGKFGYDSLKGMDGNNSGDFIVQLNRSAAEDAVKLVGGDPNKLGPDYFDTGKTDAKPADKVAALMKLSDTLSTYIAGRNAYGNQGAPDGSWTGDGPSPGQQSDGFIKDVQDKISKLANDPDVQKFENKEQPAALHSRIEADPRLKAELERRLEDASSPRALEESFNKKDKDGKPLTTTAAVLDFVNGPSFYAQALGGKLDFKKALDNAPQEIKDKVKAAYDDIASGKDIQQKLDSGESLSQAITESGTSKVVFDTLLDDKTVKEGTDKFNETVTKFGRDDLLKGANPDDMFKGLGLEGPNDPGLEKMVNDNLDGLFPDTKDRPPTADIVNAIRRVHDLVRNGVEFDVALKSVSESMGEKTPKALRTAFKAGIMHATSGIMLAGLMGIRSKDGTLGSDANKVALAIQTAGLIGSGGIKFVHDQMQRFNDHARPADLASPWFNENKLANMKALALNVLGVGDIFGAISFALGASEAGKSGDKAGAAVQGTLAGLNGINGLTGFSETIIFLQGRLAASIGQAGVQVASDVLGGIVGTTSGLLGGAVAAGSLLYLIINGIKGDDEKHKVINTWYDGVKNDFGSFGITPPDRDTTLAPANGAIQENGADNNPTS